MLYDIVQVIPYEDYTVYVYFEDGKIVCYDAKPLLDKKAFAPLKNIDFFMNACTILNDTLADDLRSQYDSVVPETGMCRKASQAGNCRCQRTGKKRRGAYL